MPKPTDREIEDRFAHHPPQNGAVDLHSEIRSRAGGFALWLNQNLPESRELSLALTELQSAAQWANAAVAIHVSGAEPEAPCPNCGAMVSRVGLKPGEHPHYVFTRGLIGSGHWTCIQKPPGGSQWDMNLRFERAQKMMAGSPNAHVLVLTEAGWTIMHSAGCRELNHMEHCDFTQIAAKINFTGWPSPVFLTVKADGSLAWTN